MKREESRPARPDRLTLAAAARRGCLAEGIDLSDYGALARLAERELVRAEAMIREVQPDLAPGFLRPVPEAARDPRTGDLVVFGPGRALRTFRGASEFCIVEDGELSPIFARRALSGAERFAFVNLNLFPILSPGAADAAPAPAPSPRGLHFLFWPSNVHADDWGAMTVADVATGLGLLADLERACLTSSEAWHLRSGDGAAGEHFGHFRIIRNSGERVGGSVAHPHLQAAHGGAADGHALRDVRFLAERGIGFGPWVARGAGEEHVVRDYGEFVWLVPPFARRRLHGLIVPRSGDRNFLYELDEEGRSSLARALGDFTRALPRAMERAGLEPAHNLVFHAGPIGGLYVEAIAPTQTVGGFEQAGMWINLQRPADSARAFREASEAAESDGRRPVR